MDVLVCECIQDAVLWVNEPGLEIRSVRLGWRRCAALGRGRTARTARQRVDGVLFGGTVGAARVAPRGSLHDLNSG